MCVCQGEWQLEKYLMIALKLITTICLPPCVSLSRQLLLSYLLLMLPAGQPPRECHTQQQQQHKEEEEEAEENAQGQQQ